MEIVGTDLENDEVASKVFSSDLSPQNRARDEEEKQVEIKHPKNKKQIGVDRNQIFPISEHSREEQSSRLCDGESSSPKLLVRGPLQNQSNSGQIEAAEI